MTDRMCIECGELYPLTCEHFFRVIGTTRHETRCKGCRRLQKRESYSRSEPVKLAARIARRRNRRPLRKGEICPECYDLPHRVEEGQCWRCDLPFAPEPPLDLRDYLYRSPPRPV